ncbi:MAG: hypothetical protein ACKOCD_06075 [Nitrospiraceae bacterium]
MSDDGLLPNPYREFLAKKGEEKGYEFQHAPQGSAAPPIVTFRDHLRWWTWDRWRRMRQIRLERDKLQQEIVQMRKGLSSREH